MISNGRMDSSADGVKKSVSFQKMHVASACRCGSLNGSTHQAQEKDRSLHKHGMNGGKQNDYSAVVKTGCLLQRVADQPDDLQVCSDKISADAKKHSLVDHLNSDMDDIRSMQDKNIAVMSPVGDDLQAVSTSGLLASLEGSMGTTLANSHSVVLSPDEIVLAAQYFPVTFGATLFPTSDSRTSLSTSGVWPLQNLSSSSKKTFKFGIHRHGKRPGSGQSSSSSNSKSSIEQIYIMATDSPGNGVGK